MRKLLLISTLALLVGCGEDESRTVTESRMFCDTQPVKQQVSVFTLQCIANANPKSDEEPEDWIRLCKQMAVDLFCEEESVQVHYMQNGSSYFREVGFTRGEF